jgi:hypothetical protein
MLQNISALELASNHGPTEIPDEIAESLSQVERAVNTY